MSVFSLRPFVSAGNRYPTKAAGLRAVHKALEASMAQTPEELKTTFSSLDNFGKRTLSSKDIQALAHRVHVRPDLFYPVT